MERIAIIIQRLLCVILGHKYMIVKNLNGNIKKICIRCNKDLK